MTHGDLIKIGLKAAMSYLPPSALPEPLRPEVERAILAGLRALMDAVQYERVKVEVPEGVEAGGLLDLGRREATK